MPGGGIVFLSTLVWHKSEIFMMPAIPPLPRVPTFQSVALPMPNWPKTLPVRELSCPSNGELLLCYFSITVAIMVIVFVINFFFGVLLSPPKKDDTIRDDFFGKSLDRERLHLSIQRDDKPRCDLFKELFDREFFCLRPKTNELDPFNKNLFDRKIALLKQITNEN